MKRSVDTRLKQFTGLTGKQLVMIDWLEEGYEFKAKAFPLLCTDIQGITYHMMTTNTYTDKKTKKITITFG